MWFERTGKGQLTHAWLQTRRGGDGGGEEDIDTERHEVAAAFIAIGHTPNTALLASLERESHPGTNPRHIFSQKTTARSSSLATSPLQRPGLLESANLID